MLLVERADRHADQRHHRGDPADRRGLATGLALDDERNAGDAEQQPCPLPRDHAFAEPAVGECRGEDRLQADHQRHQTGGQVVVQRDEHTAEIEPVHEDPGDRAVHDLVTAGPGRARQHDHDAYQQSDERHAQRQEGQRLRIRQPELRADESGGPQHHEHAGRGEHGHFFDGARHINPNNGDPKQLRARGHRARTCVVSNDTNVSNRHKNFGAARSGRADDQCEKRRAAYCAIALSLS